jgi:hypothetical protein
MRIAFIFILIVFVLGSCKEKFQSQTVLVEAEDRFEDFSKIQYNLKLLSDSTYRFTYNESEWEHEKNETFRGRYLIGGDTIFFTPFRFEYSGSNKAIFRNNFIVFIDGLPFRMRVSKTVFNIKPTIDTIKFKDYALFNYDSTYYYCFSGNAKAIDLTNTDLDIIDSLINIGIKQNHKKIHFLPNDYYKQCVAILNAQNEKEVWINFLCKKAGFSKNFRYYVIHVDDGGDCFLSLKINLNNKLYYNLGVNGRA